MFNLKGFFFSGYWGRWSWWSKFVFLITSGYPWRSDTIRPCLQGTTRHWKKTGSPKETPKNPMLHLAFGSQDLSFRTSIFGSQDLGFRTSINGHWVSAPRQTHATSEIIYMICILYKKFTHWVQPHY
jgi:hypothetical protein